MIELLQIFTGGTKVMEPIKLLHQKYPNHYCKITTFVELTNVKTPTNVKKF